MKITELISLDAAPTATASARFGVASSNDPDIVGITADSRHVGPGFLFVALNGTRVDGRRFAAEAMAKGAIAILTDDPAALDLDLDARERVAIITDPNPQRLLALTAARFDPARPKTIAAVTGTNGKTSVAHFTRELWQALADGAKIVRKEIGA